MWGDISHKDKYGAQMGSMTVHSQGLCSLHVIASSIQYEPVHLPHQNPLCVDVPLLYRSLCPLSSLLFPAASWSFTNVRPIAVPVWDLVHYFFHSDPWSTTRPSNPSANLLQRMPYVGELHELWCSLVHSSCEGGIRWYRPSDSKGICSWLSSHAQQLNLAMCTLHQNGLQSLDRDVLKCTMISKKSLLFHSTWLANLIYKNLWFICIKAKALTVCCAICRLSQCFSLIL